MLRGWHSFRNSLDLALRNHLTWSPSARERSEPPLEPPSGREAGWVEDYQLSSARGRMTRERWRRNLAVLEILDRIASEDPVVRLGSRDTLRVLDIGSKNFDYVDALAAFWSRQTGGPVTLTGLEVDAHRRYTDLRTRRAWAEHYCSFVPGSRYLPGDLAAHQGRYDVVTWFFPFVTEYPLLRWGLPRALFRPQALFDHAHSLLEPGGVMVLVNLTAAEAEVQHELVRNRGLAFLDLGPLPSSYSERAQDQRLTLVLQS